MTERSRLERRGTRMAILVVLAICVSPLLAAPGPEEDDGPRRDDPPPEGSSVPEPPIPEIPPDKLPPATGRKPDPGTEQFIRAPVQVRIDEIVVPRDRDPYVPGSRILNTYVAEYFRRAGHPVVEQGEPAEFYVVGNLESSFVKEITYRGSLLAVKFAGDGVFQVLDADKEPLADFDLPDLEMEAIVPGAAEEFEVRNRESLGDPSELPEEAYAVRDLSRRAASELWRRLYHRRGPFGDGQVQSWLDALTVDDIEAEEPVDGNEILRKLVRRRFEAVPVLLEALTDDRPVLVPLEYPGLSEVNRNMLRVYHVADKALEEIFQKVSRMGLDTPPRLRFVIIKGWENEWKRFCPAFRRSPPSSG